MKTTKYTNKELVEIYKNLKTSAKILGFASASDCEMMVAIELEAVKRHLNLIDGTVEETAEKETIEMKTNFEGKGFTLTQEAYYNAGSGMYEAHATDNDGKEYIAYFEILEGHEDDEFEDTMCDWDNATSIFEI